MTRRRGTTAGPVELTDEEKHLADDVRSQLAEIRAQLRERHAVAPGSIDAMGKKAHELHLALKKRGREPRHRKTMIANRGVPPTSLEFYRHVHPVEDLLAFIADQGANDDPTDVTLGQEFPFRVYSRRWGHEDTYTIRRMTNGWSVAHGNEIMCGRDGRVGGKAGTGLFRLLDQDQINYPEELPGYFEWLWEQAAERGLTRAGVQQAIAELAEWVSICERATPGGVFGGFK